MFNVKIQLDLYVYTSYVNCEVFKKISLGLGVLLIDSTFYTVYPVVTSLK